MFIPDPELDFYPSRIPDPEVKKAPDPESRKLSLSLFTYNWLGDKEKNIFRSFIIYSATYRYHMSEESALFGPRNSDKNLFEKMLHPDSQKKHANPYR
jgi:hypothetical protein